MVRLNSSKKRPGKGDLALVQLRGVIRALACTLALGLLALPMRASSKFVPEQSRSAAVVRAVDSVGMTVSDIHTFGIQIPGLIP